MITPNTLEVIQADKPGLFDPAENFVEASKLHRRLIESEVPGIRALPRSPALLEATGRATKPYRQRPPLALPDPGQFSGFKEQSLNLLLQERRSPRGFVPSPPPHLDEIGWLCWAADGDSGEIANNRHGRTAPSGGALYPRDLYLSAANGDLEGGLYHYNPYKHHLEYVNATAPEQLASASAQPDNIQSAPLIFVITAAFWRNRMKYNQRGVRFALMESGHVAQNIMLGAAALGLSALPLGGFFDEEVNALAQADGLHETVLYLIVLGRATPSHLPTQDTGD